MITVTGATGKLGRLVVEGLLTRVPADEITAAVRSPEKAVDLAARGVQVRRADYGEPDTLLPALEGTDRLLLISGNDPGRSVAQHTAVIDAAKQIGVSLLAYTSLVVAVAPPRATEPVIQASGLPFTMLRNGQYTSHYEPQIQQALATGVLVGSAGAGYRNVSFDEHLDLLLNEGVPRPYAEVYVANYRAIAAGAFATATTDLRDLIGRPTETLAEFVAEVVNSSASTGRSE